MCKVTMNEEKNGIEIRFDEKPDKAVLEMLKDGGFRWSQKQKMWYAKKNDERMSLVANLDSVSVETKAEKVNTQDNVYDLFEMTRTDTIGNNVDKSLSAKEIAAIIRKSCAKGSPIWAFMPCLSDRARRMRCIERSPARALQLLAMYPRRSVRCIRAIPV